VKTILTCEAPCPKLRNYSRETTIAEKYEIMLLSEAIRLTFLQRSTPLPEEAEIFNTTFAEQKQIQWNAFRNRMAVDHIPESFTVILECLVLFLSPVTANGSLLWLSMWDIR
jgi:hypothetical protein